VQRLLDAYANNELLVETAVDVAAHLEECSACADALDSLQRVRTALKNAVVQEIAPPALRTNIRSAIARRPAQGAPKVWAMAAGILLAVFLGAFGIWNSANRSRVPGTFRTS
jgi:anti-sigma factor RsiW